MGEPTNTPRGRELVPARLVDALIAQLDGGLTQAASAMQAMSSALQDHEVRGSEKLRALEGSISGLRGSLEEAMGTAHAMIRDARDEHEEIQEALARIEALTRDLAHVQSDLSELKHRIVWGAGIAGTAAGFVWWFKDWAVRNFR